MVAKRLNAILKCPSCEKVNNEQSIYICNYANCSYRHNCTSCLELHWNKEGIIPFKYEGCADGHGLTLDKSKVKEIVKYFPKTCAYTSSGCNLISVLKRHEPFCEFRPLDCPIGENDNCEWKGTVKDWQEHLDSVHPSYVVEYSANVEKKVSINLNDSVSVRRYLHKVDGKLFVVRVKLDDDQLAFTVRKVSLEKTNRTHYLSVIFRDKCDFVLYRFSIKSKEFNDKEGDDEYSANVPTEELKGVQDDEGAVDVSFVMISK